MTWAAAMRWATRFTGHCSARGGPLDLEPHHRHRVHGFQRNGRWAYEVRCTSRPAR